MAHKTKDGTWRVRTRVRGRRVSKNFPTKAAAERYEASLLLGKHEPQVPIRCKMTFAELADRWLEDYCKVEKAETQHREDKSLIEGYLKPAFGGERIDRLTKAHLNHLKVELAKGERKIRRKLKPKSINHVIGLAKKIMATAADQFELIAASPFAGVSPLKVAEQPFDYWTPEERDHFLRHARHLDLEFTRAVQVACFTGLRLGEIAGLTRSSLDFERRLIFVGRSYNYKLGKALPRTKSGRVEHIPMNEKALQALRGAMMLAPDAPVFDLDTLNHAVDRFHSLCKRTGARAIRFHDLRHTFASCLAMQGVDLYAIQRLMRHSTIQMTQRYAHLSPGHLRSESEKISGPDLSPTGRNDRQAIDF